MPYPPLNISHNVVNLSKRAAPGGAAGDAAPEGIQEIRRATRRVRDVPLMEDHDVEEEHTEEAPGATQVPFSSTLNLTGTAAANLNASEAVDLQTYWLDPSEPPAADRDDEFVNAQVPEYEDSNDPGSAMAVPAESSVLPTKLPPVLLELRWLPPRPPTSYDGFNVYIHRDGRRGLR